MADISVSMTDQISGTLISDVDLKGLDNVKVNLGGGVKTELAGGTTTTLAGEVKVDSDTHLKVDPLTTSSKVDLEPVTVDSCVRLELGALPATDVHTPYEQRWALEVLGVELMAFKLSGATTTSVRPVRHGTVFDIERHENEHRGDCGCGGHGHRPHPVVIGD